MPDTSTLAAPLARLSDAPLAPIDDAVLWPGRHVEVGGQRIHIRTTPPTSASAEPALFVHGLGGAANNWTELAALLRDRLSIEAIDLPGHGRSGPALRRDYSLDAHARTVIAYLEHSGRGPVHLVGNSLGGATSILVAARRPDLVRTLTLISPAVLDGTLPRHFLRNDPRVAIALVPGLGEAAFRRIAARYPAEVRVRATITLCFYDRARFPAARMRDLVDEAEFRRSLPWSDVAFLRSMRAFARLQATGGRLLWNAMRQITAPTLVLWGDTDRVIPAAHAARVAATIRNSRVRVFEQMGHTAMMEDPVQTARAIVALLEDAADAA